MLIGLSGRIGSGKDTVYRRIFHLYDGAPMPVLKVSFAEKMKQSAGALLGVEVETLEKMKNDPYARVNVIWPSKGALDAPSISVREFLQRFGTESHRDVFGQEFWLDHALPLDYDHSGSIVCVTDVRFPNEIERIRDLGGVVWRVHGPKLATSRHISESILPSHKFDVEIDNQEREDEFASLDGTLQLLIQPNIRYLPSG